MGFFFTQAQKIDKNLKGLSPDFLRRHGCNVCPLNEQTDLQHPKMLPTGSKSPTVTIIGESPSKTDDQLGKQFAGKVGKVLRDRIPEEWQKRIRWTNIVNCRTNTKIPDNVAQQCCFSRLEKDIIETKPKAIFGFGPIPLFQILKQTNISLWRGRRTLVDIGGHVCWFYPMLHPLHVVEKRRFEPRDLDSYGSDDEFVFVFDLKKAFSEIDSLPQPIIHSVEEASANIEIVDDINRLAELLGSAAQEPSAGIDIETNCLRPYAEGAKILSIAISTKNHTFAFAVDHSQSFWTKLERKQIEVLIRRFLYESTCRKVVHHLPFEFEWFGYFYGTRCFYSSRWDDSESQGYLLDARRGGLSLDFLCLQYFGLNLKAISGLDRKNLDKSPLRQVLKYNGIDARYHRLLYLAQAKRIKHEGLEEVYEQQLRRIPSLVLAQMQGVPIDQTVVQQLKQKYEKQAASVAKSIEQEEVVKEFEKKNGRKFNPSSPSDVNYLLRELVGIDLETTGKDELAHIDHPIAKKIVQWREPNKVISTYIDSVSSDSENVFPDGMLHPIISTTTVFSWRTSSDSPNIQNFPKRDEERKEVRSQVKSSDQNMMVVSFDYAGIQARNVAMESKDKKLVEAYWHNYDIHSDWRERIVKKFPKWIPKSKLQDEVAMKHYRYLSKNKFVFPAFFGAQSFTLSEGLGIPKKECEELREEFFDEFVDIKKWHEALDKYYYENGYVKGLSDYHCRAPLSSNQRINLPIQSDESCIVMDAMSRLSEMEDPRYQPMLEVHDDLTFLWPKKEIEKRAEIVIKTLITVPFKWANIVPIEVEMSVGPDWINMKEVGKFSNDKWNGVAEIKDK